MRHPSQFILASLLAGACNTLVPDSASFELAGVYAGSCEAGEGRLHLREDGTFLLSLVAAKGGTQWTVKGQWFDGGRTFCSNPDGDPGEFDGRLRPLALECREWSLNWSTGPGLTAADMWEPLVGPYFPVHYVTEGGVLYLHAWDLFVLQKGRPDC